MPLDGSTFEHVELGKKISVQQSFPRPGRGKAGGAHLCCASADSLAGCDRNYRRARETPLRGYCILLSFWDSEGEGTNSHALCSVSA